MAAQMFGGNKFWKGDSTVVDDSAIFHLEDAVGIGGSLGRVGYHEYRLMVFSVDSAEKLQQGGGVIGVEIARGLIRQQNARAVVRVLRPVSGWRRGGAGRADFPAGMVVACVAG